ncbi:PIG-L family deacetylase [Marinobacter sp. chi1]|uniref:PIG-L family deacetylase n=1 Tax=Marinobacter suaedae TaxID=3057675 RepID=A0ABT8VWF1_9GAMM|nr:PIG-L family deacetylase [Marinobacter sp. chi1]MDO3720322.1 PIG-L family deacetylase [Marinobacter sp. chi1]
MMSWLKGLAHLLMTYALRIVVWQRLEKQAFPAGSIMVIAPHPDDEIIGAGGVILQALEQEQEVHLVYLTEGEAACPAKPAEQVKSQRRALTRQVAGQIGLPPNHQHFLGLADGAVPQRNQPGYQSARQAIQQLIDTLQPDHVLATHELDYWPFDHVACAHLAEDAVAKATHRPNLYLYWVWAWYNLRPWHLSRAECHGLFAVSCTAPATQKQRLVSSYLDARAEDGSRWSGELPLALRRASRFSVEILQQRVHAE